MNKIVFLKIKNFFPTLKLINDDLFDQHNEIYSRFFICNIENVVSETITIPSSKVEELFTSFSKVLPPKLTSLLLKINYIHIDVNSVLNDDIPDIRFYIDYREIILNNTINFFEDNYPLNINKINFFDSKYNISLLGFLINKNTQTLIYKYYIDEVNNYKLILYRFNESKEFIDEHTEIWRNVKNPPDEFFNQFNIYDRELISTLDYQNLNVISRLNTSRTYLTIF